MIKISVVWRKGSSTAITPSRPSGPVHSPALPLPWLALAVWVGFGRLGAVLVEGGQAHLTAPHQDPRRGQPWRSLLGAGRGFAGSRVIRSSVPEQCFPGQLVIWQERTGYSQIKQKKLVYTHAIVCLVRISTAQLIRLGVRNMSLWCGCQRWPVLLTVSGGAHAAKAVALGEQAIQRFVAGAFTQATPAGLANQSRVRAGLGEDDI